MRGTTHLSVRDTSAVPSAAKHSAHFFQRLPVQPLRYSDDTAELIPVTKKAGVVSVALADAKKVKIASTTKSAGTIFNPTELPTIRFRGALTVSDASDEGLVVAADASEAGEEVPPATSAESVVVGATEAVSASVDTEITAAEAAVEPTADPSVRHLHITVKRDRKHKKARKGAAKETSLPLLSNPMGVIGMRRARIDNRNPKEVTLAVAAQPGVRSPHIFYLLSVGTVVAVVLAVVLVGFESHVSVSSEGYASSYSLTFSSLVDLVKERLAALLVHSFSL